MATGSNTLPIGLGGDAGLLWFGAPGTLPAAFSGSPSTPLGLGPRMRSGEAQDDDSILGKTLRGRLRLAGANGWWEAECAETPHPSNEEWPERIDLTIDGQSFLITADAIAQMAEGSALCGADEEDLPISSLAGALEKLAARLPSKGQKHHRGLRVDEWDISVDTTGSPWRVTDALYKPE